MSLERRLLRRRGTRDAFPGSLVLAVPTLALAPYTAWVLVYDVPWSYRLWGLNPS